MKEKGNKKDISLKEYVEKNKKEISDKCWEVLIKILNDRNDGNKYEIVNPQ